MTEKAFVGIDPETKQCVLISEASPDQLMDAYSDGLIIVPVSIDTARKSLLQAVPNVYEMAGGDA